MTSRKLRVAFIHPDLGIGGAERLVVDAALGLQRLGHSVDIYTSHHDPSHCFEETRDGTSSSHPPFPRSYKGKFHILLAHARQLHLTCYLLSRSAPVYDVYFVDQLSTCVPLLRAFGHTRVLFYCHFPDKLLADGEYVAGKIRKKNSLLKRIYRMPMDMLEELTTRQADVILANSKFTASVFRAHFTSIRIDPKVVYPGINISVYETAFDSSDPDIQSVASDRPTLLSINRFEKKKNAALAVEAFALLRRKPASTPSSPCSNLRLVLAGGYDPRVEDNLLTLAGLIDFVKSRSLSYAITKPVSSPVALPPFNTASSNPDVLFLLNFATSQRSALLTAPSTLGLLYTPTNEHFGIGPVEAMVCGLPVLACDSGGPTESVVDPSYPGSGTVGERTGWLRKPDPTVWAEALEEIVSLPPAERAAIAERAKARVKDMFSMEAMSNRVEQALGEAVALGPVGGRWILWMMIAILTILSSYVAGIAVGRAL
ncbi:alpha-1,3-mannosyltransferase ALG2 [Punctularia strigosozonata HHB-11173 SS5]|uniref:alpha-1,3-mannosyltransferase ALG2 n=1 Tax=Punctularia strigosozonata (strain HHB-11173) TaxID=741275 RepID=UPI00044162E1|nr:alpha-1,3-mannosyltransferase ALG2 [Punctularia strigosozonata HHB-11173 SS5]EIN07946.1 alpha-1,3-mannosyltransferase ALG2 [Punctularia strigosozonata HHB-11173 SS5]